VQRRVALAKVRTGAQVHRKPTVRYVCACERSVNTVRE
jgi:hypothetical protein